MKKTVSWKGLIAMAAVLATGLFVISCTDDNTYYTDGSLGTSVKGSIKGLVIDVNNNPIEGAEAWLRAPGVNKTAVSDATGQYLMEGVPHSSSPYLINVVVPLIQDTCAFEQTACVGIEQTLCDTELGFCVEEPTLSCIIDEECPAIGYCAVQPDLSCTADAECPTIGTCAAQPNLSCTVDADCYTAEYATTYTAAELSPVDGVVNTMAEAVPAVMRRQNATVRGWTATSLGEPVGGALVTMNPETPPNAQSIIDENQSTLAIGDPTTLSSPGTGLFSFSGVPEGSDANPVGYVVTVSASGLQLCNTESHPSVMVGTGNHEYWVEGGNAVELCPTPIVTESAPWVTQTNLPAETIAGTELDRTWCWQFSKPVNEDASDVYLRFATGAPIGLDPTGTGWNLSEVTALDCPVGTAENPVFFATPSAPLVSGQTIVFEVRDVADTSGRAYTGLNPDGEPDAFTSLGDAVEGNATARAFTTGGDARAMCVDSGEQAAALSPTEPGPGGKSAVLPQANNFNELGPYGVEPGQTDTFTLNWNAAAACDGSGEGQVVSYRVYADFGGGIPVLVHDTAMDADPLQTGWTGTLTDVNEAAIASGVPPVTDFTNLNYFDNDFTMNMVVTAVNVEDLEGPISMTPVPVKDNVPPTAIDQGEGFDTEGIDGADPTYLPFLTVVLDLTDFPDPYVATDLADLLAADDVNVDMSEDMAYPQEATGILTAADPGLTLGSVNIVGADLRSVTAVLNGINLVTDDDTLALNVTDEAGNPSEADAAVILLDGVVPMIADAVDTVPNQELMITFSEPVEQASAETLANYSVNGVIPESATLSETDPRVVTLAAANFEAPEGLYVIVATGVLDLAVVPNSSPGIGFQFQGVNPPPVILQAVNLVGDPPVATAINSVPVAVPDDGIWSVGDVADPLADPPVIETFSIEIQYSEPLDVAAGIAIAYTGGATCVTTEIDSVTCGDLCGTFDVSCTDGTVAVGDSITVTAYDFGGNPLGPAIILNAVGEGTNIDPIVVPVP